MAQGFVGLLSATFVTAGLSMPVIPTRRVVTVASETRIVTPAPASTARTVTPKPQGVNE